MEAPEDWKLAVKVSAMVPRTGAAAVEASSVLWANNRIATLESQLSAKSERIGEGDMRDAYEGAREDLLDWKRRALTAEAKVTHLLDECNGPTFMGEPVFPPSTAAVTALLEKEKQRSAELEGEIAAVVSRMQARSDNAYIEYIGQCGRDECLGEEIKMERGLFKSAELKAHRSASQSLGRHKALFEAVEMVKEALSAAQSKQGE